MKDFFYPNSVAVIGVSSKPTNLGRNIVRNMIEFGFDGIVYAVGPRGGMIETRRIYKSVGDIPDHIDLAVIMTPAATVPGLLEECGEKGIRRVLIQTAGFREYSEKGLEMEHQMNEIAARYNMRFIGPNGIGAMNMENGLCAPFLKFKKFIKKGDVSIITQSGGVGMSAINLMTNEGVGLNKMVSVGNQVNTNAEDILEYLIEDPGTNTIFLYMEGLRDGRRLMDIAKKSPKPILAFKSNIGILGQKIAASHTASITSDDSVVDAAFEQAGIIRIHDGTAFASNLKTLELPPMRGRKLAIISRSGGHAIMAADACELSGFQLAKLSNSFLREIEKHFKASVIKLTNPLDLGDLFDLKVYAQIIEQTLQLKDVDGIVFLHTAFSDEENEASRELLTCLVEMVKKYDKPVTYFLASSADEVSYLKQNFEFPIFTRVVETIRALEINHKNYLAHESLKSVEKIPNFKVDKVKVRELIDKAKSENRDLLLSEAIDVLESYGIPAVKSGIARTEAEVKAVAEKIGYPVAIKVIAEAISHKSDIGGVQLNIRNATGAGTAFKVMMEKIHKVYPDAEIDGVLVQPMVNSGHEMIVGGRQDEQFGPVVVVGLGGIFVEVFKESEVRVAPITKKAALDMVESLRGYQILKGSRGHKPYDVDSLVDAILRISQLLVDFPEIAELDINPLRVLHEKEGSLALDGRIILD
jgi:acetyltransferase